MTRAEDLGQRVRPGHGRLPAHGDVLSHREAAEQLGPLEGPAEPTAGPGRRPLACDVNVVQHDLPRTRPDEAPARVEQRGLAPPLRPDQAGELARRSPEADPPYP